MAFFSNTLVAVLGGGDLASGAIYRLHRAGFPVYVTELPRPLFVRRAVSFGEAVYSGRVTIEGVTAQRVNSPNAIWDTTSNNVIPVIVDAAGESTMALRPVVVVDARMGKRNIGIRREDAPFVVALGPGYTAGVDCHAVIETNRGHDLGRVIYEGTAEPDTGVPGKMIGKTNTRVLRAPVAGTVRPFAAIGDSISEGTIIAEVGGHSVVAGFDGVLRGLIHESVQVTTNMKIGDLDPRNDPTSSFKISDKALAVGGGVVEAVLASAQVREHLRQSA